MTRLAFALFTLIVTTAPFSGEAWAEKEPFFMTETLEWSFQQSIPSVGHDFSGITYVPSSGSYWIIDDTCKLIEIYVRSDDIETLRTVALEGLEDCEAVTWLDSSSAGEHRMAIVEERKGNLVLFTLPPDFNTLECATSCETYFVEGMRDYLGKNTGLEALASQPLNPATWEFFIGKEDFPKAVYRAQWPVTDWDSHIAWLAEEILPPQSDIAGMAFFEKSLFVLDEKLATIRQIDSNSGQIISTIKLPPLNWFQKYEGLAFARKDKLRIELVVVAERNAVFVYRILNAEVSEPLQQV